MKRIAYITFIAVLLTAYSCGQKQGQSKRTAELPPDTAQLSPLDVGPYAQKDTPAVKDTMPRAKVQLVVTDVQAQLLDSTTQIGHAGDLLLTFVGSGFIFTNSNPALVAGEMSYNDTHTNEKGTELYVIITTKEMSKMLADIRGGEVGLVNPGLNVRPVMVKQTADEIKRKVGSSKAVGLMYAKFGVERRENR